jgi:fatty acid desaturase
MVHHKDPLSEKDFEVMPQARLTGWALIGSLIIDLGSAYRRVTIMVKNAFGVVPNGAAQKFFPQHSEARTSLINGARVVLISHFVFVLLSIYFDFTVLIIFITIAPFVFTFPNRILSALQHFNLKPNKESNLFSSIRTIIVHPVIRFFYAGMNYHVEHHLFPTVPFYNLPVLHKRLIELGVLVNFEPSFWSGFRYLYANGYFQSSEGAKQTL